MSCKRLIGIGVVACAVSACASLDPVTGSVDRHFGEAFAWNKAVQTIDPDPVYPADGAKPGDNGAVAVGASKRYRTDQVKPVETLQTTSTTAGSSSGSGSGPR